MPRRLRRHDETGHVHLTTSCSYRRLQIIRHKIVRDTFLEKMITVGNELRIRWIVMAGFG